jgi:hypothetical protein|tara:strand:- start:406 stop:618 length:213 start_codon:yes stop_codon:yes gene_type:complete
MKNKKKNYNIVNTNIFTHPEYMKSWGKQFVDACGNTTMNIPPDMGKLRWLMEKFVKDYNEHLIDLGGEEE